MGAPVRPQRVGAPPPPVKAHGHLPLLSQNPSKSDAEASGLRHAAGPLQVHRSGAPGQVHRDRGSRGGARWCAMVASSTSTSGGGGFFVLHPEAAAAPLPLLYPRRAMAGGVVAVGSSPGLVGFFNLFDFSGARQSRDIQ